MRNSADRLAPMPPVTQPSLLFAASVAIMLGGAIT
jgi:hypothetical protein